MQRAPRGSPRRRLPGRARPRRREPQPESRARGRV